MEENMNDKNIIETEVLDESLRQAAEVEYYYAAKKKRRNIILDIVLIVLVLIIIGTGAYSYKAYTEVKTSKENEAKLAELTTYSVVNGIDSSVNFGDVIFPNGILEKYKAAYATNQHLVGWLKIPNTYIDQPVVQCENNSAYLKYDFYKNYNQRGSVFMDYRNEMLGDNTSLILYGHNFYDRTMLSDLEKYESFDFYKTAPVIEFNTIYKNMKWKVVAVFITTATASEDNGYVFNYIYPFLKGNNYAEFLTEIKKRSIVNTGVDVNTSDKLLILSTCTKTLDINGKSDGRCVVVARLVRDGESEAVDVSLATVNSNPKYPQIWYTKHKTSNPFINDVKWEPIATR